MVRPATAEDAAAITRIENHAILNSVAHFGLTPIEAEDTLRAFHFAQGKFPWLVAEIDGAVVGFARSGPWKTREAYRFTTEVGVYIDPKWQGKGIGKAFYTQLFEELKKLGFRTILAGITLPNPASVGLHESFGMKHLGTIPRAGFKFEEWHDTGYWVTHLLENPASLAQTQCESGGD